MPVTSVMAGGRVPTQTISTKSRKKPFCGILFGMNENCEFLNCPNIRYTDEGLCSGHLAQKRAGKRLTPIGENYFVPQRLCEEPGCGNKYYSKNMCRGHYLQEYKGKPKAPVKQIPLATCKHPECEYPASVKGLCNIHAIQSRTRRTCSFEGCERRHEAKGYCKTHASQLKKRGYVSEIRSWGERTGEGALCFVPSCENRQAMGKGCRKHATWAQHNVPAELAETWTQQTKCFVCEETPGKALCVDHDHNCCPTKTSCGKCIRGLICGNCNSALGHAKDDPERLRKLADYLESF